MIFIKLQLDIQYFLSFLLERTQINKKVFCTWDVTREHATYSCLCKKRGFSKFSSHTYIDFPCGLMIGIVKASRIGNIWIRKTYLLQSLWMRGNSTILLFNFLFKIIALIMLLINFFTESLVPLQSHGGLICFVEECGARQIEMLERTMTCLANKANLIIQLDIWRFRLDSLRYR